MKKRYAIILITAFITHNLLMAQIKLSSVSFYTDYSYPLKKKLLVTKIDAAGGGVDISFSTFRNIEVSLIVGYKLFSLQQDSAIQQWNWRFYKERYAGIIRDNLASDSTLSAYLNPVQKMDLIPVQFAVKGVFSPINSLCLKTQFGAGVYFYTRRLYLEETWRKIFNESNYTFEYSYRNFATNKYGNPLGVFGSLEFSFQPSEIFTIGTAVGYTYFIKTEGKLGFDQFPISDFFDFKVVLTFLY